MSTPNINNYNLFTEIFSKGVPKYNSPNFSKVDKNGTGPFGKLLQKEYRGITDVNLNRRKNGVFIPDKNPVNFKGNSKMRPFSETYLPNQVKLPKSSVLQQYMTYKEDQLLSNPGGDYVFLNKTTGVIDNSYDHGKFTKRVGKDLSDAGGNFVNAIKDIGLGAKIKYVDKHGIIREGSKVGFVKTVSNFFKNVASGLTFGKYTPKGEEKPVGAIGRIKHFFSKIFKDAVVGDIVKGIPRSAIQVGEDLMFAGLNAIEVIPDATIGNFKAGRKATTTVFDNTQVALDFATDILPGGEAAGRTHSIKFNKGLKGLPIVNNITTPEKDASEQDWKYVRNTKFRKVIETISSLIPIRI